MFRVLHIIRIILEQNSWLFNFFHFKWFIVVCGCVSYVLLYMFVRYGNISNKGSLTSTGDTLKEIHSILDTKRRCRAKKKKLSEWSRYTLWSVLTEYTECLCVFLCVCVCVIFGLILLHSHCWSVAHNLNTFHFYNWFNRFIFLICFTCFYSLLDFFNFNEMKKMVALRIIVELGGRRRYVCLGRECAQEFGDNILEFLVVGIADLTIGSDLFKQSLLIGLDMSQEFFFEFGDFRWVHFVQVATDTAENDSNLVVFSVNTRWEDETEHM